MERKIGLSLMLAAIMMLSVLAPALAAAQYNIADIANIAAESTGVQLPVGVAIELQKTPVIKYISTEQSYKSPGLTTTIAKVYVVDGSWNAVNDASVTLQIYMPKGEALSGAYIGNSNGAYSFEITIPAGYKGTDVSATAAAVATRGGESSALKSTVKIFGSTGVEYATPVPTPVYPKPTPSPLPVEPVKPSLIVSYVWSTKTDANNYIYAKVVDQNGNAASGADVTAVVYYGGLGTKIKMEQDGSYFRGTLPLLKEDTLAKITVSASKSGYSSGSYSGEVMLYGKTEPDPVPGKLWIVDAFTDKEKLYVKVVKGDANNYEGRAKVKLSLDDGSRTLYSGYINYNLYSGYYELPTSGLVDADTKATVHATAVLGEEQASFEKTVLIYGSGVVEEPKAYISALWSDENGVHAKAVKSNGNPATPQDGYAIKLLISPPAIAFGTGSTAAQEIASSASAASGGAASATSNSDVLQKLKTFVGNVVTSNVQAARSTITAESQPPSGRPTEIVVNTNVRVEAYMTYEPESGYWVYTTNGLVKEDTQMGVDASLYKNGQYVNSMSRVLTIYGSEQPNQEGNVYDQGTYQWCPEGSRTFDDLESCDEFGYYPASHVYQSGDNAKVQYGELVSDNSFYYGFAQANVKAVGTDRTANWRVPWIEISYKSINQNYKAFIGLDGYAYLSKAKGYTWQGDEFLLKGKNKYNPYDSNKLEISLSNENKLRVYVNEKLEIETTDSSPYVSGKVVFRDYNGQAGEFSGIAFGGSTQTEPAYELRVVDVWADEQTASTNFIRAKVTKRDGVPLTEADGNVDLYLKVDGLKSWNGFVGTRLPMHYDQSSGYWRYYAGGMFEQTTKAEATVIATPATGAKQAKLTKYITVYGTGEDPIPQPPSTHTIGLYRGWNMISAPDDALTLELIQKTCNVRSRLWYYDGQQYQQAPQVKTNPASTPLVAGQGYWIRVAENCFVETSGKNFQVGEVKLHTGWNQIGTPNENYPYSEFDSTCTVKSGPWWYDAQFDKQYKKSALTEYGLSTGYGYWLKVSEDCKLVFGESGMPPAPPEETVITPSPAPTPVPNYDANRNWRGTCNPNYKGECTNKVTIVEFSDFQCPYCARANDILNPLLEMYPSDLRLVYRQFPLSASFHPNAQKAAEASECAGEQGKFWQMHDMLFANQDALGVANLKEYAREIGMDAQKFDSCLDSGRMAKVISFDQKDGEKLGVQGTPTFFINAQMVVGADADGIKKAVESALGGGFSTSPSTASRLETLYELNKEQHQWKVDYALSTSAGYPQHLPVQNHYYSGSSYPADLPARVTYYEEKTGGEKKTRLDMRYATGEEIREYDLGVGTIYRCTKNGGEWDCNPSGAPLSVQLPYNVLGSLWQDRNSGKTNYDGTMALAGTTASCFKTSDFETLYWNGAEYSYENIHDDILGKFCYSSESAPMYLKMDLVDSTTQTVEMKATGYSLSVDESDFELPG
jgi:protein-disulfide isomerase